MAKKSKLLTQKEIHKLLKPRVEEIIKDVQEVSRTAIEEFYNDPSFTMGKPPYERTGSFGNFGNVGEYEEIDNGYNIIFKYSAEDVEVNPWSYFNGDPIKAFDADFVHGYHGGPKSIGRKKKDGKREWVWTFTSQLVPSPWERIKNAVNQKYF